MTKRKIPKTGKTEGNGKDQEYTMGEFPFSPPDLTLAEILRKRYIKNVARWLLGNEAGSVLAQAANSCWESALTVMMLSSASDIFLDNNEEADFRKEIEHKSVQVCMWLLSKQRAEDGERFITWEGVTWDTAVSIHCLLICLKKYADRLSETVKKEIRIAAVKGTKWLLYRFQNWEKEVKYPFGPADVGRIAGTLVYMIDEHPDLYADLHKTYLRDVDSKDSGDWVKKIVEYLIHVKTEQTLTINVGDSPESVVTYWWDDYFSTAEVVEALAMFHQHCARSPDRLKQYAAILATLKQVLIRACTYFEKSQVDGMWGSHIDTIKIIYAYVLLRRLIPQRDHVPSEPLIVPEIHTTFKALRWMCDEKQIFSDGSFLHTMFLTVFYAGALIEVYRSWEPCACTVEKIYDDVVWFSPVRTTPERSKRLAAEMKMSELQDHIDLLHGRQLVLTRSFLTAIFVLLSVPLFFFIGEISGVLHYNFSCGFSVAQDFYSYGAVFATVWLFLLPWIWAYYPKLYKSLSSKK